MSKDYEIGYRRPPKHTRFKPGQSGNPKGRRKGAKNLKTDLAEELRETLIVTEGGQRRRVSKQRAMVKSLVARAIKGDPRAITLLGNLILRLMDPEAPVDDGALPAEDKAILEAYEAAILARATAPNSKKNAQGDDEDD